MKVDVAPLRSHRPDLSCKAAPVTSTLTSPDRRRFLSSLLANAKKKLKLHTARPPGDLSTFKNEIPDPSKHDLSKAVTATTSSACDDSLNDDCSDIPGLSDDEEMPELSRPDHDSD